MLLPALIPVLSGTMTLIRGQSVAVVSLAASLSGQMNIANVLELTTLMLLLFCGWGTGFNILAIVIVIES